MEGSVLAYRKLCLPGQPPATVGCNALNAIIQLNKHVPMVASACARQLLDERLLKRLHTPTFPTGVRKGDRKILAVHPSVNVPGAVGAREPREVGRYPVVHE